MQLNELFNSSHQVNWEANGQSGSFEINGQSYPFQFTAGFISKTYHGPTEFGFRGMKDGRMTFKDTGGGNQFAVYSTAFQVIKQYLDRHPACQEILVSGFNDKQQALYKRFAEKFGAAEFDIEVKRDGDISIRRKIGE